MSAVQCSAVQSARPEQSEGKERKKEGKGVDNLFKECRHTPKDMLFMPITAGMGSSPGIQPDFKEHLL